MGPHAWTDMGSHAMTDVGPRGRKPHGFEMEGEMPTSLGEAEVIKS